MIIKKCGCCGDVLHKIENGTKKYFLTTIDMQSKNVDMGTGMPVDAYGCVKCGAITLFDNSIVGQQPRY